VACEEGMNQPSLYCKTTSQISWLLFASFPLPTQPSRSPLFLFPHRFPPRRLQPSPTTTTSTTLAAGHHSREPSSSSDAMPPFRALLCFSPVFIPLLYLLLCFSDPTQDAGHYRPIKCRTRAATARQATGRHHLPLCLSPLSLPSPRHASPVFPGWGCCHDLSPPAGGGGARWC